MTKATVLCTLPMDEAGLALFDESIEIVVAPDPGAQTLYEAIGTADILLVRNQLPADLFERPNRLLGVVRNGTGLDFIPVASATAKQIPVANVPGANAQAVVEYCISSLLLLSRPVHAMDSRLRTEGWNSARMLTNTTTELAGKTIGIIGLGSIGSALAKACKYGFGMRVTGYQPRPNSVPDFVEQVGLDTLFSTSDFISLNCPLNSQTEGLVNTGRLRSMKRSAVIVNASRGAVIDDIALTAALRDGQIKGAALDVFRDQPLRRDHPFLGLDNVILTPHAAALTRESSARMSVGAARQIVQILGGERPDHLVNPEVWDGYLARRHAGLPTSAFGVSQ